MTENKRFSVHAEEYQDTDDMGYAIAPPIISYHVGNSEIGFNFDTEREANMLCEAWNKFVEENKQLKEEIQFLFNQIKAFRDDCRTYQDFNGASTLNRLIEILEQSKEIFE